MKLIFVIGLLCIVSAPQAQAICLNAHGRELRPVATADADGVVTLRTPTGKPLRISGLAPSQDMCAEFLFKSTSRKCSATGSAHVAEERDPRFCKRRPLEGRTCVHLVCD